MMIQALITALTVFILTVMSLRANGRFKDVHRLPMQFSLSGSVNWTAPRQMALAFTPALYSVVAVATSVLRPRPGQEGVVVPTMAMVGLVFIGIHALHLWLIGKAVRPNE